MGELNKIFYVEDEVDICEIVYMVFEFIGGFEVVQVEFGIVVLDIVEGFVFDMIFIDVQMLELMGLEIFEVICKMLGFENILVIYMIVKVSEFEKGFLIGLLELGLIFKLFDLIILVMQICVMWDKGFFVVVV